MRVALHAVEEQRGDLVVDDDLSHVGETRGRSAASASVERLLLSRRTPRVRTPS
jgi:hypothetical protein